MRNAISSHRVSLWLLATTICLGVSVVVVPSAGSQTPEEDHLKCYQTFDSNPPDQETVALLNAQFGTENCTLITKAPLLCAPTIKNGGNDPLGGNLPAQDYLCYRVIKCTPRDRTVHRVTDQFGSNRLIRVGKALMLCAPAQKGPALSCGDTAPLCNGPCPTGQKCTKPLTHGGSCFCQ